MKIETIKMRDRWGDRTSYLVLLPEGGFFDTDWKADITVEAINWFLDRMTVRKMYVPTADSDSTQYILSPSTDLTEEQVNEMRDHGQHILFHDMDEEDCSWCPTGSEA